MHGISTPSHPPYPWQRNTWARLMQLADQERLPHAILLDGMKGIGKKDFAIKFAATLLCLDSTAKPCNQCKSCLLLKSETHPDYSIVQPEAEGKLIKIDQIRELTQFLAQTAQQGGRKVVIVTPAENMNLNATNALLKSLEEPQGDSVLILVSANPSRLLATVRSRCLQMKMQTPNRIDANGWLTERIGEQADSLLSLCHGAPLAALEAFTDDLMGLDSQVKTILQSVLEHKLGIPEGAKQLTDLHSLMVVDVLLQWVTQLVTDAMTEKKQQDRFVMVDKISTKRMFVLRDRIVQVKRLMLSPSNPNIQLLWEEHLFDWEASLRG